MDEFKLKLSQERQINKKMQALGIREGDIKEIFIRSSGPGGSNANKVSTCVYLKHIPTGIEVKCQKERYQAANRIYARLMLLEKIENKRKDEEQSRRQAIEKARRSKRKRSKAAKERMLEQKHKHSLKKQMRKIQRYDLY